MELKATKITRAFSPKTWIDNP